MAERMSVADEALKKLADQLECSICLDSFTDPKLLQCFHVFCKTCLEPMVIQGQDQSSLHCPNCRRSTILPSSGVSGLQSAFHIHHLFEIQGALLKVKKGQEGKKTQCEKCRKRESNSFCRDCAKFICEVCNEMHQTWEDLATHKVISLDQLNSDATNMVPPARKILFCSKHPGKELDFFCETESVLTCQYCIATTHRDHKFDLISDIFPKHRDTIVTHLEPIKQQLSTLSQAIQNLDTVKHQITTQQASIEVDIQREIKQLHEALEVMKTKLMGQLHQTMQKKLKILSIQRDEFELMQIQLNSCLEFIGNSLKTGSEGEILAMEKPVVQQVKQMCAEYDPRKLQPQEQADVELIVSELLPACQQFEQVLSLAERKKAREAHSVTTAQCSQPLPMAGHPLDPSLLSSGKNRSRTSLLSSGKNRSRTSSASVFASIDTSWLKTHVRFGLASDALILLDTLPEKHIPGVYYDIASSSVLITGATDDILEKNTTKFQDAYQGITAHKIKKTSVELADGSSEPQVRSLVEKFRSKYTQCAFVLAENAVKIVSSSSRSFDAVVKLVQDELRHCTESGPPPQGHIPEMGPLKNARGQIMITLSHGRTLTLKQADIVKEQVDVIVNAANKDLLHGGGVAGAIDKASYGAIQRHSHQYVREHGTVSVGQVAVTRAGGNLKCSHVFHAVGPTGYQYSNDQCHQLLMEVTFHVLQQSERYSVRSVAIPAISSGIYGVDKQLVADGIISSILIYQFQSAPPVLSDIRIVIIDKSTYSCFAQHLMKLQKGQLPQEQHRGGLSPANATIGHSPSTPGYPPSTTPGHVTSGTPGHPSSTTRGHPSSTTPGHPPSRTHGHLPSDTPGHL